MNVAVAENLKKAWEDLKTENPKLRIRNAAQTLNVSELELLATGLGKNVVHLASPFGGLLQDLQSVGPVMALSRNEQAVHEKHGIYTDFKVTGKGAMGICLGDIDLRVFFSHWKYGVAVQEGAGETLRESFQFFDAEGGAIHKVYRTSQTDKVAWDKLIAKYQSEDQTAPFELSEIPTVEYENSGQVDAAVVQEEWRALKDVHHFNAMLKRLGISRTEALSLVGEAYAKPLSADLAENALRMLQERKVSLMAFVGNRGIVQIHTGTISKLLRTGPWFNVLDPTFNLHLNTAEIASVWRVIRPTAEGNVTSLEFYNSDEQLVLTLFGERKPGNEELAEWRQLVADVETLSCGG